MLVKDHTQTRKQLFYPKMKVITCTNFMVGHLITEEEEKEEEDGKFANFCMLL